ncbi:hypothetical protein [Mycobacterium sp. 1164985.4]|uniref:hypothetical protein n=1 Tax=Mycobacterium sp. 1164985.4 TaxID=1834069 RepID=UPI0007FC8E92|nr:MULTISPECIES: hypothetical protein [unclassified Mycobacterium]OBH00941.1 hypothetical protein A5698_08405 [Mycobacterium sp. E136]OBK80580.1 hypothetical protein A5650_04845 [Mycobacterium sp. 1164985.4]
MLKALGRIPPTAVGYVSLLLSFAALGTFVYALAAQSAVAGIIGAGMVVLMVMAVAGFRVGARKRAESNDSGIEIPSENIWARPLRREQIDHYLSTYRGARDNHEQLMDAATSMPVESTKELERQAA